MPRTLRPGSGQGLKAAQVTNIPAQWDANWFRSFITTHMNPYALQGIQGQQAATPPTMTVAVNSPLQGTQVLTLTAGTTQSTWAPTQTVHLPDAVAFDVEANGGLVYLLFGTSGAWGNGYIIRFDARAGFVAGQILKMTAGVWTNIGTTVAAANSAALGGTYRLVAVMGLNGAMKVYVDGELQCTATDTTYTLNGSTYMATEAISNTTVWAPSAIDGTLDMTADGVQFVHLASTHASNNVAYNFRGVWSGGNSYVTGDEVVYGQTYWLATANSTGSTPATGSTNWQAIGSYSQFQGTWSGSVSYAIGAEVTYSGNYWVCVAANTNSAPSTTNANWQIAGPASITNLAGVNRSTTYAMQCPVNDIPVVVTQMVTPSSLSSSALWQTFPNTASLPGVVEWDVNLAVGGICDVLFNRSLVFGEGYMMRLDGRISQPIGQILLANSSVPSWADIGTNFAPFNGAAVGGTYHLRAMFGSNGYMELWVNGQLCCAARDTTFTPNGSMYGGIEVLGPSAAVAAPTSIELQALAGAAGHVSPLGSFQPSVPSGGFTYTSTTSSITWSWPSQTLYLPNGQSITLGGGNTTVGGLSASTTYTFYPYVDFANSAVGFANGGVGTNGFAFAAPNAAAAAQMYLAAHLPFNGITASTPASGSGGGGGNQFGCLHPSQRVDLADGAQCLADELSPGMLLPSPDGPVPIAWVRRADRSGWVRVVLSDDTQLTVTLDHRFLQPDGEEVRARDLTLGAILAAREGHVCATKLELLEDRASMVSIELAAPHLYYLNGTLSHNPKP